MLPRLVPLLDENLRAQVADTRNQLDVTARIFMLSLLAVPTTTVLLIRHDSWLLVPTICYVVAWVSYRSAVAAARRFCDSLAVVFDLHHLLLWDAMSLSRPRSVHDAREHRGGVLTKLLAEHHLALEQLRSLVYEERRDPPVLTIASSWSIKE